MHLCFILLILSAALNGCFSKKTSWKRSAHKRSHTKTVTEATKSSASNSSTQASSLNQLNGSFATYTDFVSNFSEDRRTDVARSLSTPVIDLNYSSNASENLSDFLNTSEVDLRPSDINSTNVFPLGKFSTPEIDLKHLNSNAVEDTEVSGILVYAPKEEESFAEQEQTLIRKFFQKFLISFFMNLEQTEAPINLTENYYRSNPVEHKKVKRNDIGDFIKSAKDVVVDTSKTVFETSKNAAKTVGDGVKKVVTRNASFLPAIGTNKDNLALSSLSTDMPTALDNECDPKNLALENINEVIEITQLTKKETPSQDGKPSSTLSEHLINVEGQLKSIDRNTKYFFGEGNTEAETALVTTHRTTKDESTSTTNTTSQKGPHKHKHRKKKENDADEDLGVVECKEEDHCPDVKHEQEEDPIKNTKPQNTSISSTSHSTTKDIESTSNSSNDDSNHDSFKMNMKENLFKYNDWLWQHLEAARNGSLKSNSTEEFMRAHHFLLNSGGTDKSATDASEFFTVALETKNEPETKLDLYKILLEEQNLGQNLSLQSDIPLKRHRRIRRNPARSTKRGKIKRVRLSTLDSDYSGDEPITLPNGIEDVTTTITTSGVTTTIEDEKTTTTLSNDKETTVSNITPSDDEDTTVSNITPSDDKDTTVSNITPTNDKEITVNNITIKSTTMVIQTSTMEQTEVRPSETETSTKEIVLKIAETPTQHFDIEEITSVTDRGSQAPYRRRGNFEKEYNDGGGIRTRPLLLLVTLPSFIGIGIFIIALCYVTRNGGWCCRLFEPQRTSQTSLTKEPHQASASTRHTIYY